MNSIFSLSFISLWTSSQLQKESRDPQGASIPALRILATLSFCCKQQEVSVTRSVQPHVHTYMFCPYVISTPYWLLQEYK
jgi:hypothetical protein